MVNKEEAYDYIKAKESLVITDDSVYNPSDIDVYVTINGVKKVVSAKETINA